MIVWFNKETTAKGAPSTHTLHIEGRMNEPGSGPIIEIVLVIKGPDETKVKTLFTHNPSVRAGEEFDNDDILAKYQHKISKFMEKIPQLDFARL